MAVTILNPIVRNPSFQAALAEYALNSVTAERVLPGAFWFGNAGGEGAAPFVDEVAELYREWGLLSIQVAASDPEFWAQAAVLLGEVVMRLELECIFIKCRGGVEVSTQSAELNSCGVSSVHFLRGAQSVEINSASISDCGKSVYNECLNQLCEILPENRRGGGVVLVAEHCGSEIQFYKEQIAIELDGCEIAVWDIAEICQEPDEVLGAAVGAFVAPVRL